ncbi:MAG: hypothetical protein WA931_16555 [Rhodococcus sp. (in: high G+C Gram-positive bacteria)]
MSEDFFTRREAHDRGLTDSGIRSGVRSGRLTRLRPGALTDSAHFSALTAAAQYRVRVRAAADASAAPVVVSHLSAAALHALPVLRPDYSRIHLTMDGSGGGRVGPRTLHRVRLDPREVTIVDGLAVTTLARTAVDTACMGTFEQAVCVVESALRAGAERDELHAALSRIGKRRGISVARRACAFADPRTESIGESWSRAMMTRWRDVPQPRLQHRFVTDDGRFVARTDFDWDGLLVGEFDGVTKYVSTEVMVDEKRREDALRLLGIHVIRWTWSDLLNPERFHRILRTGLERAGL